MVLATKTSALNTSLAVIRPKPRPDSPTASEISVIMLKSELPHEAPNPVSKKASRVHIAARRCGSRVAALGARAAACDAGDRVSHARIGRLVVAPANISTKAAKAATSAHRVTITPFTFMILSRHRAPHPKIRPRHVRYFTRAKSI